jgi:FHS family L-fucose permease-like MFS transporter
MSSRPADSPAARSSQVPLMVLSSLFFSWGFLTCLNDVLIPHLRAAFSLGFAKAALVQFAFFAAYALVSIPAGRIVARLGYARGLVVGLGSAGVGCVLFYPAAGMRSYPLFLGALFVLASGITVLQVSANPYVAALGPKESAPSRLTLTQAFNSAGTFLAPWFGSYVILSVPVKSAAELASLPAEQVAHYMASEADSVRVPYLGIAFGLFALAFVAARLRLPDVHEERQDASVDTDVLPDRPGPLSYPHLVAGIAAIFLYVGAEVSIGSFMVSYLGEADVGGLPEAVASRYLAFYWGGALVGRFVGAGVLRRVSGGRVLAVCALAAALACATGTLARGPFAIGCALSIGLFNSIMFPTIFALALAGLGRHTRQASGLLCTAIVGGALVPLLHGALADRVGLHLAFLLPATAYAYIAYYGWRGSRPSFAAG